MKFYRIMDESVKDVNAVLNKEVESAKVRIQGSKALVEIKLENVVYNISVNGIDLSVGKQTFIVRGKSTINDVEADEIANATVKAYMLGINAKEDLKGKQATKWARENNTYCECTFNGNDALYYAKEHKLEIIFDGLLYVA